MEKIAFTVNGTEKAEFYVLEQTKIGGTNYILVTDMEDGDGDALILKDLSKPEEKDGLYEIVSEEKELGAVLDLLKESAQRLQSGLGIVDHTGDLIVHGPCTLGGTDDHIEGLIGFIHFLKTFIQRALGGGDIAEQMVGTLPDIEDAGIHIIRQPLDLIHQLLDLCRYDSEAAALLTGARRLDGSVQREDVGLFRDGDDFGSGLFYALYGILEVLKGVLHLVEIGFYLHGAVLQFFDAALGVGDGLGDRILYG